MSNMNPVVHFEISGDDKARMVKFYQSAFGWQAQQLGPEMGEYILVQTTETDPATSMPKEPARINGGFYQRTNDPLYKYPSIVIAVDNLHESMEKVKAAGGSIHGEVQEIPGYGTFVSIIDTEGNRVGLMQPTMN